MDFLLVLLSVMTVTLLVLTIIELVLFIMRNRKADLIYRLIPLGGLGLKKALSDLLIPLLFMFTFLVDAKPGIVTYIGLLFFVTLAIFTLIRALVSIDLHSRGIFTNFRFIPWKDVVSIKLVKKMHKEHVISRSYVLELSNRRLLKKLTINTEMYHNPEGIIGETLSERGFQIDVVKKE